MSGRPATPRVPRTQDPRTSGVQAAQSPGSRRRQHNPGRLGTIRETPRHAWTSTTAPIPDTHTDKYPLGYRENQTDRYTLPGNTEKTSADNFLLFDVEDDIFPSSQNKSDKSLGFSGGSIPDISPPVLPDSGDDTDFIIQAVADTNRSSPVNTGDVIIKKESYWPRIGASSGTKSLPNSPLLQRRARNAGLLGTERSNNPWGVTTGSGSALVPEVGLRLPPIHVTGTDGVLRPIPRVSGLREESRSRSLSPRLTRRHVTGTGSMDLLSPTGRPSSRGQNTAPCVTMDTTANTRRPSRVTMDTTPNTRHPSRITSGSERSPPQKEIKPSNRRPSKIGNQSHNEKQASKSGNHGSERNSQRRPSRLSNQCDPGNHSNEKQALKPGSDGHGQVSDGNVTACVTGCNQDGTNSNGCHGNMPDGNHGDGSHGNDADLTADRLLEMCISQASDESLGLWRAPLPEPSSAYSAVLFELDPSQCDVTHDVTPHLAASLERAQALLTSGAPQQGVLSRRESRGLRGRRGSISAPTSPLLQRRVHWQED